MVILHVKHGDASQFLYETSTSTSIQQLLEEILNIYNGRLKVYRVMAEMEELAKHGTFLPPDMLGLTDEQVEELKLRDDQGERCKPSGYIENKDPIGRRNGYQPPIKMQDLIKTTIEEVKNKISKTLVERNQCLTEAVVQEGKGFGFDP
ncbi:cilia- and flagella-associated protein 298 isoform X2 [Diaphorina citri]|nr:cilia- and flagella-associated protein 298 isoform X2 [Diaphorina citri]XP_026679649.1 cilia- and flagella-associated protein 298 isoform X2 [Diaphorina citri]XP_026679650.1 cilia- and flagella-associated protein 298 isoform X2 [Diaphorina citri]